MAAIGALCAAATTPNKTDVSWTTLDNERDSAGFHYIQRLTITGNTDIPALGFNQFARGMKLLNPCDTIREVVPGYYILTSSRFDGKTDIVVVDIDTRGYLVNRCYAPDGFHRIELDGTTTGVALERTRITNPGQWTAGSRDLMHYGPEIYDQNQARSTDWTPGVYDILPSFKSVELTGGTSSANPEISFDIDPKYAVANRPEHVEITVNNGRAVFKSANLRAAKLASTVFKRNVLTGAKLPNARLVWDPDFEWRGMMIDIARNFQRPETLKKVLLVMAGNGLNKLHFHPVDDEAWRLEMESLPELTSVGSRRGYGTDESDHLYQIFTGDGNPDNLEGTSNGYYTRDEFIDILRFADNLGIDVVTEIESPGHARAAIKAMERRAADGDASYRLVHDGDTSKYTSAQSFHDNIMNPALEGPYKFMETVIDDIEAMYKEAGVPLTGIHIGGDEVPRGSWSGSSVAQKFMAERGMTDEKQLHAYFVERVGKMLADRGIPMHGWQEVALDHGSEYDARIAPITGGVNCWSTIVKKGATPVPVRSVNGGYPTILSNVDHLYFDLSYSSHPEEPGLTWGGNVDEFSAFTAYADQLCPVDNPEARKLIRGLNAHCFAETMRGPDQLLMYLTPKMSGLAERAAHSDTTYTEAQFNKIIGERVLPLYQKWFAENGVGVVHMRQPGIKIVDGMVYMNAPYTGGTIRYTTDGTEPTESSPVYTEPFKAPSDRPDIRARYYRNGAESVTTYLER